MKLAVVIFFMGLSLLFYQNCAPYERAGKEQGSSATNPLNNNNSSSKSIEAYELTLAQVITESQSCSGCHGVSQFPLFAVFSTTQAHNTLLNSNLVNLDNPASSRLVRKIREGHQNFSESKAMEIERAIENWASRISF